MSLRVKGLEEKAGAAWRLISFIINEYMNEYMFCDRKELVGER